MPNAFSVLIDLWTSNPGLELANAFGVNLNQYELKPRAQWQKKTTFEVPKMAPQRALAESLYPQVIPD